mgnify:CR=1 FL=1
MKFIILFTALFALASAFPSSLLPGGRHSIDVNNPQLIDALEHVQDDLNARLNSMYYHKIVKVISAQSQVVAGVLYHVDFEFAQTQCLKSKVTKETRARCTEASNVQICHVKILSQPWLNLVRTEEFHCSPKQNAEFYEDVPMPGGKHKMDVHDAHLQEVIVEAETKINAQLNSQYYHKIIKVLSAESQVVSGVMYFINFEIATTQCLKEKVTKENRATCDAFSNIQVCEVQIHSQPWLNVFDVSHLKCIAKTVDHKDGGLQPMDVHNPQLLEVLSSVQDDLNVRLNSMYYHKIVKVLSAQSQVVAGVMYHVEFEFGMTKCLKSKVTKETVAQCTEVTNVQICNAKILSQPWLHHIHAEEFHCSPKQQLETYEVIVGGRHKLDVHDAHLMEMVIEAETKINAQINSPYYHKIIKVLSAESQVVSGVMYFIDFEIASTQCLKEKVTKENRAMCDAFASIQVCQAHILSQSWRNVLDVTSLKCTAKTF